jgi:asparagine synthase (glutamine-hydrolysing)
MCGIAGLVGPFDPRLASKVEAMVAALRHRGPDDKGVEVLDGAVLGHARLSIIDLVTGHQPMSSADGRYWIVFNGEIYNFRELRAELESSGHVFRTTSDTEVLLTRAAVSGPAGLGGLNGMFAFALWDAWEHRLLAARDRLGKKPFYYALLPDGSLAFASEPKALLRSGLVRGRIALATLDAYLALGYVPPEQSAYADVQVLPPAHWMEWQGGRVTRGSYWVPRLQEDEALDEEEAARELRRLVSEAVRARMVADVPIGAFLSGGLDSSTVVALMQRESAQPVRTFGVGFGDLIDELPYAAAVAGAEGTEHHELQMNLPVGELLQEAARVWDEPLADSSNLPTLVVSRFARERVKVVLTGDGGDEMFGGYDWWYRPLEESGRLSSGPVAYGALRAATRALGLLVRLGAPLGDHLKEAWEKRALVERARAYPDLHDRHLAQITRFPKELRRRLWRDGVLRPAPPPVTALPGDVQGMNRAFWLDLTAYLPGDILVKVDRASMAVGLETRCPLLDPAVVEFALSLPVRLKRRAGQGKQVFRRAFAELWPEAVRRRSKHGFGGPEATWLRRKDVRALVARVLRPSGPLSHLLNGQELTSRCDAFYHDGRGFSPSQLWTLLSLGLWLEEWAPH